MSRGLHYKFHKPTIRRYLKTRDPALLPECFAFADTKQGHEHWHAIAYKGVQPTAEDIDYLERLLPMRDWPKEEEDE